MKNFFALFLVLITLQIFNKLNAQVNIGGIINQYSAVSGFNACRNGYAVANPSIFSVGDRVLMIQMKGSLINQTNTANFGDMASINASGLYEFAEILSINGNTITFVNELVNGISPASTQLIKVPVYQNATITSPLTCMPYNGSIGGVLVFEVNGTLTFQDNIDVSENGYRGGVASQDEYDISKCGATDYLFPTNTKLGGQKGEGNTSLPVSNQTGRGPLSNGGGGGNHANAGGGGGGNRGFGGVGGNQWTGCSNQPTGGIGGKTLPYVNRIFMGGGGGGGQQNDGQGTPGKNGGGIVIIKANQIIGNGKKIISNGGNADLATIDGAGGAGAGGTILLGVQSYSGNLAIEAKGGNGGNTNNGLAGNACYGPGGGGGGGLIRHKLGALPGGVTTNVAGGSAGMVVFSGSNCYNTSYGAAAGQSGAVIDTVTLYESTNLYNPLVLTPIVKDISCIGSTDGEAEITSTGGKTPFLYNWIPNVSSSNTATGLQPGSYMVVITQSNACKDTTTFTVNSPTPITLNYTVVNATCGHANGQIEVTPSGGSGNYTYDWPNLGKTTAIVTGIPAGSHQVIVTDDKGCQAQVSISVTQTSTATPQPNLVSPVYYCLNENPNPLVGNPSTPTAVVNWYGLNPNGPSQPNPNTPTTNTVGTIYYYVTQSDNGCESPLDSIEVVVVSPPTVQSTLNNPTCGYLDGQISIVVNGGGNLSYLWSPGNQTTANITALDTGNYELTITYGNNCQHKENFQLLPGFIPDPVVLSPVAYCLNDNAQALQATASTDYSLLWYDPVSGNPQATPITPLTNTVGTTNYLVAQSFKYCVSKSVPIVVNVKPLPQVVSPSQIVCSGNIATLTASGADTYKWRIGGNLITGNNVSITTLHDTTYTVIGTLDGCVDSIASSVNVLVMPEPVISYNYSDYFCETRSINFTCNYGQGFYQSEWFYNNSSIGIGDRINYQMFKGENGPHNFKVIVDSQNGCSDSTEVQIPLTEEDFSLKIYIPNSFTPNGDKLNDTWFAIGECYKEINYRIFNRWGEMIIESSDMDFEWDGTHNGQILPSGVYYYEVMAKGFNFQDATKYGKINLCR